MHKLLQRQLSRFFGPGEQIPHQLERLFSDIDDAYLAADKDRTLLERSLELTSQELLENNRQLREELHERRLATEALQQTQSNLRQLIEKSAYGVVVRRNEKWVFVNPAWAKFLGYDDPALLIGKRGRDFFPVEERERYDRGLMSMGPGDIPIGIVRFLRDDGAEVLIELFPAEEILFDGQPAHLIQGYDVTNRKKLEEKLLLSERMASLGTMVANVAHEINNPLASMLSNISFAIEVAPTDNGDLMAALTDAEEGGLRIRQIVREMKVFSRADEETPTTVDVEKLLTSTIKMAQNEIRHRAKLVTQIQPVSPIIASESKLSQAFLNLIINAAQAIPVGKADQNQITIRAYEKNRNIVIEVQDTGSGIPKENITRIFEPFFTTKERSGGTGLGLSICHRIITSFDGQLEVESTPNQGSLFRVLFPSLKRAQTPTPKPPPTPLLTPQKRIMIIDDEPAISTAIQRMLRSNNIPAFTDAREALKQIQEDNSFDVVICDLMMPTMTGIEFFQELVKINPALSERVLFTSGGTFTQQAKAFIKNTAIHFIEKPFTSKELITAINQIIGGQQR